MYNLNLKWYSCKADLSDILFMLDNQKETYAVLKYCREVPDKVFFFALELLGHNLISISYKKLFDLIERYSKTKKVGFIMDEEFVETIEIPVMLGSLDQSDKCIGSGVGDNDDDEYDEEINIIIGV